MIAANQRGNLHLSQPLFAKLGVVLGLFERGEIMPLQVFQQRERKSFLITYLPHEGWDRFPPSEASGPPPAFPTDEFIPVRFGPQDDRFQQSLLLQTRRQLFQPGKIGPWLPGIRING